MLQELLAEIQKEMALSKAEIKDLKSTVNSIKKTTKTDHGPIKFKDQAKNDKPITKQ